MKRIYPTLSMILLLGLQATPTFAQNDDFVKQFQQARQGMMDDYNKFRNTILTDYDKYMQGAWKEYKKFKGDARSQVPKPKTPPVYEEPKQPEKPVNMKPKMPVSPIAPKVRPTIDPVNKPKLPEEKAGYSRHRIQRLGHPASVVADASPAQDRTRKGAGKQAYHRCGLLWRDHPIPESHSAGKEGYCFYQRCGGILEDAEEV